MSSVNPFVNPDYQAEQPEENPYVAGGYRAPLPESVEGVNFAYRGGEQHGVPVEFGTEVPADMWEGGYVATAEPEPAPEPVPVRIVEGSGSELKKFRVFQTSIGASAAMVINRFAGRSACKMRNLSADKTVWVSSSESVSNWTGYPVPPGSEFTTDSDDEVWAVSGDGSLVSVAVYMEYAVGI